jgi:ribonucleoside-diphosphate reductase alpha chain
MANYASVIDALSHNDLRGARDVLLEQLLKDTAGRNSWDAPWYTADKAIQAGIKLAPERNQLFSYFGLENLQDRYLLRDASGKIVEDPQGFYARVATGIARGDAAFAQELYDIMSKHWFLPATPVLMNIGTNKGLPISCFLNTVPDTLEGIFDIYRENAFLAKNGGGIGTNWSELRGNNAPLKKSGLKSSGVIPFLKVMDSETLAISRNSIRRGAAAAYLRIDHPDIEEFLEVRKPGGGDLDRKCFNIHQAVVITDAFMQAVEKGEKYALIDPHYKTVTKELDAVEMWRKLLTIRAETGEPYFFFHETVNRAVPPHHREKGLFVNQSNLCSEIVLPTNAERTAVCCLSSLNLERYDEWKDQMEHIVALAMKALDNNLDTFIEMADPVEFKKAIFSAKSERSVGLGVMGYHGYLMSKNYPFESVAARSFIKEFFAKLQQYANKASEDLAKERGLPLDGGTRRNSYMLSLQPTASTAFLCGEATPCVEPVTGNAYLQKTLSGSFLVKNKYLDRLLTAKGMNTEEVWKSIIAARGSVQHLDALSEAEKAVFRTAEEMNMREIVQQAADRQPFICQAQSINLFFRAPISGKYLHETHFMAWKLGVKTLYYLRSSAPIEADKIDVKGFKRDLANEECAVCQ